MHQSPASLVLSNQTIHSFILKFQTAVCYNNNERLRHSASSETASQEHGVEAN